MNIQLSTNYNRYKNFSYMKRTSYNPKNVSFKSSNDDDIAPIIRAIEKSVITTDPDFLTKNIMKEFSIGTNGEINFQMIKNILKGLIVAIKNLKLMKAEQSSLRTNNATLTEKVATLTADNRVKQNTINAYKSHDERLQKREQVLNAKQQKIEDDRKNFDKIIEDRVEAARAEIQRAEQGKSEELNNTLKQKIEQNNQREAQLDQREGEIKEQEESLKTQQKDLAEATTYLTTQERMQVRTLVQESLEDDFKKLEEGKQKLETDQKNLEEREAQLKAKEQKLKEREARLEAREKDLKTQKEAVAATQIFLTKQQMLDFESGIRILYGLQNTNPDQLDKAEQECKFVGIIRKSAKQNIFTYNTRREHKNYVDYFKNILENNDKIITDDNIQFLTQIFNFIQDNNIKPVKIEDLLRLLCIVQDNNGNLDISKAKQAIWQFDIADINDGNINISNIITSIYEECCPKDKYDDTENQKCINLTYKFLNNPSKYADIGLLDMSKCSISTLKTAFKRLITGTILPDVVQYEFDRINKINNIQHKIMNAIDEKLKKGEK